MLFCCGLVVWGLPEDDELNVNEQPASVHEADHEETKPTPSPTTKSATPTPSAQVKVIVSSANIRSGPGINYPSFQFAFEEETFNVIASNKANDWYVISLDDGDFGWIAASVVTSTTSLQIIKVAATIPAPPADQPVRSIEITLPPATAVPAAVCSCSGNLYNCSNFGGHSQAQACFNYCISQGRGDIHRLDRDNDGLACEN